MGYLAIIVIIVLCFWIYWMRSTEVKMKEHVKRLNEIHTSFSDGVNAYNEAIKNMKYLSDRYAELYDELKKDKT